MPALNPGAYVIIRPDLADDFPKLKPNAVYRVEDLLTRNVRLAPLAGGPAFSINPVHLVAAPPDLLAKALEEAKLAPPRARVAAVVRFAPQVARRFVYRGMAPDVLLVVIKEHLGGEVDLAPLGGTDKGLGWRKVPAAHLTIVPLDRITVT